VERHSKDEHACRSCPLVVAFPDPEQSQAFDEDQVGQGGRGRSDQEDHSWGPARLSSKGLQAGNGSREAVVAALDRHSKQICLLSKVRVVEGDQGLDSER
jgi:hypothetical protein